MIDLYYISGTNHATVRPSFGMRMSLFSDNSRVYQKPGSYSVGVGSVRNHRVKSKHT